MLDRPTCSADDLTPCLLAWFDGARRDLPWRQAVTGAAAKRGLRRDPYRVWLSEIMLQQTTVAAVIPYFEAFLARWPGVADLAAADLDDVLTAWAGLGYYARARNLHKCARHITADLGGRFPETYDELVTLPGIGPYTAGAIAAIAFGEAVPAVDGNVIRVLSRLHALETPTPQVKGEVEAIMVGLLPSDRPGDFAEALMDLGAGLCAPRNPDCSGCPWGGACRARAGGQAEGFPRRAPKKAKPTRRGVAFWAVREDGAVLLQRRPEKGLLGGMMEVPSTAWEADFPPDPDCVRQAPFATDWQRVEGLVRHTFTHFHLELQVVVGHVGINALSNGHWCRPENMDGQALPTVMRKVAELACKHPE